MSRPYRPLFGMQRTRTQKATPQTFVCGVRFLVDYSTTASYWMELTMPSVMMMVRVEVVPGMM